MDAHEKADGEPSGLWGSWRDVNWIRVTILTSIGVCMLTGVLSYVWPKTYRAEARILPNSTGASNSILGMAAATGLGDLISGQLGAGENPVMTYPEILSSRTMRERVLSSVFPPGSNGTVLGALGFDRVDREGMDKGVKELGTLTKVDTDLRSGMISISAISPDSVLSAYIVNQMLLELDRFNLEVRASRERATRIFVETRMGEAQGALSRAEQSLARFREMNMRIGNSPQLQLELARLEREVETRSELYRLLAREFEMARIEEKRDTPTFSIIDPARPPVRKHSPRTLVNMAIAFVGTIGARAAFVRPKRLQLAPPIPNPSR